MAEDLDSYYTDKFIKHREVFDWIDQFTSQFQQMGLIGDTDDDSISFKREILSIIKKESWPDNSTSGEAWDTHQIHDLNPNKSKQGYGIMACRNTCNDAVQDYWEGDPGVGQERANSWGFGSYNPKKPETKKYPVRVTDYADINTGKVTDPKKAMYRGAMYYAILRNKISKAHDGKLDRKAMIQKAFQSYNGRGSAAKKYGKEAIAYYNGMTKEANQAPAGSFGEFWDKSNLKQRKGQTTAQGLAGAPKAVWNDIASTYRNLGSPSDRQTGKGTLMRAVDQAGEGEIDWTKSFTEPVKAGYRNALKAWNNIKSTTAPFLSDIDKELQNKGIIAKREKQKLAQNKKEKSESLEESTEQEILAKFAKEVLGLDISDEQMQQVIQRLDITDIVGIKRAIESGDFEGLSLGESRLKEYHSNKGMADRAKEQRAMKEPNTRAPGEPLAPREPKRIAGNNPNPEAPPTGASNSTRKPVPSMPKSQIAKKAF